jgi:hypothetical protein
MSHFLLIALTLHQAPCLEGQCPIVPRRVEWRSRADEPGRIYLYLSGRQIGGYDGERDQWRDFDHDSGAWSQPRPFFPRTMLDFGVMRERLAGNDERHSLNGDTVSAREALAAIGKLEDDSDKLRLTIIGPEAERRAVLADLESHPELEPLREGLLVQSYAPEHWAVADAGFARAGKPTIYLQAPDGTVKHRQDDYRGPDKLAEAIRRADPHYRPERDPDLNRPTLFPNFHFPRVPGWAWAVAGILLLIHISQRRNAS